MAWFSRSKDGGPNEAVRPTIADVQEASKIIRKQQTEGKLHNLPLIRSNTIRDLCGAKAVWLKPECLQVSGAYKIRGATNKVAHLSRSQKQQGVIAASAGNHAQGVAIAATDAGVKSVIVMPWIRPGGTPEAKVKATRAYQRRNPNLGSQVVLYGQDFDAAYEYAKHLEQENSYVFVEPFNDPDIIAGQGTIGLEIYEGLPEVDVVLAGVGGGGLIAGIAVAMEWAAKQRRRPVKVIGVEASGAASMRAAFDAGHVVTLDHVDTIADGIKTKKVGELPFRIVQRLLRHEDVFVVSDDQIMRAIGLLLERCKLQVEGAGAAAVAAMMFGKVDVSGKTVVAVLSGGNLDLAKLGTWIGAGSLSTDWMDTIDLKEDPGVKVIPDTANQ